MFQHAASLVLAASLASAHVIMIEPHPYNLDTEPYLQTWPLSEDLPFPCQGRTQHAEKITTVTAGSTQTVKFWGSAVHGGGSCQFSVAYGNTPPSDPEAWHTIYSVVGGCPAEAEGNLPEQGKDPHGRENGPQCGNSDGTECVRQYNVPIPKEMKNGPAVFAWTWFNKIGNREMYMTCAPIIVVGGTDSSEFVDSLPAVFRANMPGECTTGQSGSVIGFPNAGSFGRQDQGITPNSHGSCEPAGDPSFEEPVKQPAKPSSPVASPTRRPIGIPTIVPSGVYTSPVTTPATPTPSPSATSTSVPVVSLILPEPEESVFPAPADDAKSCDNDGGLVCMDEGFFGICNHGWARPQPLAAGTICKDGKIAANM